MLLQQWFGRCLADPGTTPKVSGFMSDLATRECMEVAAWNWELIVLT